MPKFSAFLIKKQTFSVLNPYLYLVFVLSVFSVHCISIQYSFSFCKCTLYVLYLVTDMIFLIHLVCVSVSIVLWFVPKSKLFSCVSTTFCTSTEHQNDYKPYYLVVVVCNAGYINVDIVNIYFLCLSAVHTRGQSPTNLALRYGSIKYV
jgi:hypothetical protein